MADEVLALRDAIKTSINQNVGNYLMDNSLDHYTMAWVEEDKTWIIEISFNAGDERTLKITLDIDPDE